MKQTQVNEQTLIDFSIEQLIRCINDEYRQEQQKNPYIIF